MSRTSELAALALAAALVSLPNSAQANPRPGGHEVANQATHIVFLNNTPDSNSKQIATAANIQIMREFNAVGGFSAKLDQNQLTKLRHDRRVVDIVVNKMHATPSTMGPSLSGKAASWGIDRIDQKSPYLDHSYTAPAKQGAGSHAYVIDTGLDAKHSEFVGRVGQSYDALNDSSTISDPHGHGTHVAGIVAGSSVGVAPHATIHGVRVYKSLGGGTTENLVAGIDWVIKNHQKPAVVNMSLSGGPDPVLETALRRLVASGITVAVAAGNEMKDACKFSPGRMPEVITVGSTNMDDARSSFSNWGKCISIFAPGLHIDSAKAGGGYEDNSGTSMASPHVAGAAALYTAEHPHAAPSEVKKALLDNALPGLVKDSKNSSNLLLNVSFIATTTAKEK